MRSSAPWCSPATKGFELQTRVANQVLHAAMALRWGADGQRAASYLLPTCLPSSPPLSLSSCLLTTCRNGWRAGRRRSDGGGGRPAGPTRAPGLCRGRAVAERLPPPATQVWRGRWNGCMQETGPAEQVSVGAEQRSAGALCDGRRRPKPHLSQRRLGGLWRSSWVARRLLCHCGRRGKGRRLWLEVAASRCGQSLL